MLSGCCFWKSAKYFVSSKGDQKQRTIKVPKLLTEKGLGLMGIINIQSRKSLIVVSVAFLQVVRL